MYINSVTSFNHFNSINSFNKNKRIKFNYNAQTVTDGFIKNNNYNAVSFTGINMKGIVKQRGILFHITHLPAERSCCGQFLDPNTDKFINEVLVKGKQTHWIMNPLAAIGPDLCPYNSFGRFSRNKYIINLNKLIEDGYGNLLKKSDLPWDIPVERFSLETLQKQKNPAFKKAFKRFEKLDETHFLKQEFRQFEKANDKLWLDTYSAYFAISPHYGADDWHNWPKELIMLPETVKTKGTSFTEEIVNVLKKFGKTKKEIDKSLGDYNQFKFEQFLFDKQFNEFNKQLKDKNINIILDLPIGVSPNGVDTWANKKIFLLNKDLQPAKISGAPPEDAYPYTQRWGHALYDYDSSDFWNYQEQSLRKMLKEGDLRLDNFVSYINRAEIPTEYTTKTGKVLKGDEIFKELGENFFEPSWISRVDKKRNSKGENMFEVFLRVAREEGKVPEDCYILEDFGPLAETEAYKEFNLKYGNGFISQRLPIPMGIGSKLNSPQLINASLPEIIKKQHNIALVTGNHDLPPLMEQIDSLLDAKPITFKDGSLNSPALFRKFCKEELKLGDEELKDRQNIAREIMKWHYSQNVKQVQTTLQDALGIYFRPNIPGFWNGMADKYLMKSSKEALQGYWNFVFPKGFLERTNKSGINPGYKDRLDAFVKMMSDLFS